MWYPLSIAAFLFLDYPFSLQAVPLLNSHIPRRFNYACASLASLFIVKVKHQSNANRTAPAEPTPIELFMPSLCLL
jgi:hypothetical protein